MYNDVIQNVTTKQNRKGDTYVLRLQKQDLPGRSGAQCEGPGAPDRFLHPNVGLGDSVSDRGGSPSWGWRQALGPSHPNGPD